MAAEDRANRSSASAIDGGPIRLPYLSELTWTEWLDQPGQNTRTPAEEYRRIQRIGEGAYGVVYKALKVSTDTICAMKRVPLNNVSEGVPASAIREISILKETEHENIVKLLEVVEFDDSIWLVLEYLDMDLNKFIQTRPGLVENQPLIKELLRQLLRGLYHCHSHTIIHRDLKPANLLMDFGTSTLKIADFGLARKFLMRGREYTPEVVTLPYRAPELLLGYEHYSYAIDVWSVGCIFAEMLLGGLLFEGSSAMEILSRIYRLMGTPTDEAWPGVSNMLRYKPMRHKWNPQDLRLVFPRLEPAGVNLLSRMLHMNPARRITAKDALAHPFFRNARAAGTSSSQGPPPPQSSSSSLGGCSTSTQPPRQDRIL